VTVLAHVGHWLVDALFVAPLVVIGLLVLIGRLRERRAGHRRAD
jgi:ascorbate-specific PTS system EIIC-type component UlaA